LAAERATSEEIEVIGNILKEMEEDLRKNRLGAKADLEFHAALVQATHNQAYAHIMNTLHDLLQEELRIAWGGVFRKRDKRKKLFQQHKNIFEAVKQHNPKKGADEALAHLEFVEEAWKNALVT